MPLIVAQQAVWILFRRPVNREMTGSRTRESSDRSVLRVANISRNPVVSGFYR